MKPVKRKKRYIDLAQLYKKMDCPVCGSKNIRRHSLTTRTIACLYQNIYIRYARHYCHRCRKHYSQPTTRWARPNGRYSHRLVKHALTLYGKDNLTLSIISRFFRDKFGIDLAYSTIHDWVTEE